MRSFGVFVARIDDQAQHDVIGAEVVVRPGGNILGERLARTLAAVGMGVAQLQIDRGLGAILGIDRRMQVVAAGSAGGLGFFPATGYKFMAEVRL